MVVVRESPRAMPSPDKSSAAWPPKSPFQALLSSPSGRKKWQDRRQAGDRSPSPSPIRRRHLTAPGIDLTSSQTLQEVTTGESSFTHDGDEDEDEETLRLKLQQIEMRLKLKKLQQQKTQQKPRSSTPPPLEHTTRDIRVESKGSRQEEQAPVRSTEIQVPISPIRVQRPPLEHVSPARQRLGLDQPFRAQEVSLKRARPGSSVTKSSGAARSGTNGQQSLHDSTQSRPKSFTERLAESHDRDARRDARKERLEQARSDAFGISTRSGSTDSHAAVMVEATRKRPQSLLASNLQSSCGSQGDVSQHQTSPKRASEHQEAGQHSSQPKNSSQCGQKPTDDSSSTADTSYDTFSQTHLSKRHVPHSVVAREMAGKEIYTIPRLLKEVKSPDYEAPDCEADYVVFAVLASKSNPLDQAQTKASTVAADDLEAPKNKFMVLHLCDFKWDLDLFLFGTAFNQFWKLTPGTLLAILNPAIMPPRGNQHSGRFSLKLTSSADAIMEIGTARDLGYCASMKKDGQLCGDWIDKRKAEYCAFHIELQINKSRKHRMEVNTMFRGASKNGDRGGKFFNSRVIPEKKPAGGPTYHREYGTIYAHANPLLRRGVPGAASLLDAEDDENHPARVQSRDEASRKRIAAAQKDRDLVARLHLAHKGNGAGAEYLSASLAGDGVVRATTSADDARAALFAKPSAKELGLGARDATAAHLSPAKDRKKHFGLGLAPGEDEQTRSQAREARRKRDRPIGWGGARQVGERAGLPPRKGDGGPQRGPFESAAVAAAAVPARDAADPSEQHEATAAAAAAAAAAHPPRAGVRRPWSEAAGSSIRSSGSTSPVKKRARFALAKGIREPGRESLPGAGDTANDDLDSFETGSDDCSEDKSKRRSIPGRRLFGLGIGSASNAGALSSGVQHDDHGFDESDDELEII